MLGSRTNMQSRLTAQVTHRLGAQGHVLHIYTMYHVSRLVAFHPNLILLTCSYLG